VEVEECFACAVERKEVRPPGGLWSVSAHWSFNQRVDVGRRPWFVLQTKHHRDDASDLSDLEGDELGRLIPRLSRAIENFTGATRVYWVLFNELGHVHLHLIPRYASDAAQGAALLTAPAPPGMAPQVSGEVVRAIAEHASVDPGAEPHPIVRGVVTAHRWFDRRLSLYGPAIRHVWPDRWDATNFAPVYVAGWAVVLGILFAISAAADLPAWARVLIALIAAFRWVDAVLYEVGILLDRSQAWLAGFERSLLLAAGNLFELSLVGAIWLTALRWPEPAGDTWLHTISLVTLSGSPVYEGAPAAIAQVATMAGGLIFLGGAIAMLLGMLGSRLRERI